VVAPSGGATAVKEVATTTSEISPEQPPAEQKKTAEGQESAGAKKLKYPFTLLEIKENAEISAVSVLPIKE
jgi:hypothetical protein